ncbi:MAG: porin [Buchnera aphidicola (Eriosoma harunire)]
MHKYKCLIIFIIVLFFMDIGVVNADILYSQNGDTLKINSTVNTSNSISNFNHLHSMEIDNSNNKAFLSILSTKKINDDLTSYNNVEYVFDLGSFKDNEFNRPHANVNLNVFGLKSNKFGSLDYGLNRCIMEDTNLIHDEKINTNNDLFHFNNNFLIGATDNILTYRNNNFFGLAKDLKVSFQYQGRNIDLNSIENNEYSLGSSIKYKNKLGFSAAGAVFYGKRSVHRIEDMQGSMAHAYALSAKYIHDKAYLSVFYGKTSNVIPQVSNNYFDKDNRSIKLLVGYHFIPKMNSSIAYSESQSHKLDILGFPEKDKTMFFSKKIDFSNYYHINKNIGTYLNYTINLLQDNNYLSNSHISTHDNIDIGLIYHL